MIGTCDFCGDEHQMGELIEIKGDHYCLHCRDKFADYEEVICKDCNGSGEGQYEGGTCHNCHGSGTV